MWWTLLALALGAPRPTGADELEEEWRSLQLLRADPSRYRVVTQPFTVEDGPLSLTIESGLLVPIFSGHTPNDRDALGRIRLEAWAEDGVVPDTIDRGNVEFVGFVWVAGEGRTTLSWTERADHQTFANHLVRNLGADRQELLDVAHGEPWTESASEAVVLTVDAEVESLFLGPDDESHDPLEVVVYGEKPRPGALARAKAVLKRRSEILDDNGIDLGKWIAEDRVMLARNRREHGAHAMLDVHVGRSLGQIHAARDDQPGGTEWLTLLRDESGLVDSRRHTSVWVLDRVPRGVVAWPVTGLPFPPADPRDPLSPPQVPVRMDAEDAYVIVGVTDRGAASGVEVVARLQLRAVGGVIDAFDLNVPRSGNLAQFEVLSATRASDGVSLLSTHPLVDHDVVLSPWRKDEEDDPDDADPDGQEGDADPTDPPDPSKREKPPKALQVDPYHDLPESRITLIPPEPLQPGEAIVIDVRWKDKWTVSGMEAWDVAEGGTMIVDRGASSGRQNVLPRLPGAPEGNPSKFRVRMVVQKRRYLQSAASGTLLSQSTERDFVTTESGNTDHRVPFVQIAVGGFRPLDQEAPGHPTVRTRMFSAMDGAPIAAEIRRMIRFYEGYLPGYPWPEHEVMQSGAMFNSWMWVASHELTSAMRAQATSMLTGAALARADGRSTGQRVLAHEIAHQWWGHLVRPAHLEDFWFAETFAESMAQIYMGAVRGTYEDGMEHKRKQWERWEDLHVPRASLTDAYRSRYQPDIVYLYGPYVFQEILRKKIGHVPYHGALDVLQRDFAHEAVTTEQLKHYFELASGEDLDDFFDFWVYGGFVPEELALEWDWAAGEVQLAMTTDVPFGRFEVPVVIDGEEVIVEMVDGRGALSVPREARPTSVELDPGHRVLAGRRVVK